MYNIDVSEKLGKKLKKLVKKDRMRYEATLNKIEEIKNLEDPDHYKNLSYDMKDFKRVHIGSHFVLIFKIDKANRIIKFHDLKHHDDAYKN